MLSVCLHSADISATWTAAPRGWAAGRSTIHYYEHPVLHAQMRCSPRRSAVVVRERVHGAPAPDALNRPVQCSERELDRWLSAARAWPLDFVTLVLTHRDDGDSVKLTAGRWGTAPVYLQTSKHVLRVDWDVAQLYPHLRSLTLDPAFAAQYLLGLDHPYSRQTIFPEIGMLTERATATWRAPFERVAIAYPPEAPNASARRLRPRVDVAGSFREILLASMKRWRTGDGDPIAMEFSGGLDSSIVASSAVRLDAAATYSYGMIMPGRPGEFQRARRGEVIRKSKLTDREFTCIGHPPFNPHSHRVLGDGVVPWAEFYEEAVGHLLGLARADGVRTIYTGMGGDELCSYQDGEVDPDDNSGNDDDTAAHTGPYAESVSGDYPGFLADSVIDAYEQRDALIDSAPQALMYTSVLESAAAVAPLYLRNGVWPVSPLVTPELVEFCRMLPVRWRHERAIHRRVLESFGYSRRITHPKPAHLENFLGVMAYALRTAAAPVIESVFADSRLAAQGLVDRGALLDAYRAYRTHGDEADGDRILGALVLELTVRSVERRKGRQLDRATQARSGEHTDYARPAGSANRA